MSIILMLLGGLIILLFRRGALIMLFSPTWSYLSALGLGALKSIFARMWDRGFLAGNPAMLFHQIRTHGKPDVIAIATNNSWTSLFLDAALVLALLHFLKIIRRFSGEYPLADRILFGVGGAVLCIALTFVSAMLVRPILPDPAGIYFFLRRDEIKANLQIDPQTSWAYFPIDYVSMDGGATLVPRNFYIADQHGMFEFYLGSNQLRSPFCAEAKYSAEKLADKIYIARIFVDDPDERSIPCLIMPIPASRTESKASP
jgi:hypothetical protein